MMGIFEAAWVIARRDFVATVFSRTFILFLLAPIALAVIGFFVGQSAEDADRLATQPRVALIADGPTVAALEQARARLVAGTSEQSMPLLRRVEPAENVEAQARRLVADEGDGYSAALSGTIDRPVLTGPSQVEDRVGRRIQLIVDEARRTAALEAAGNSPPLPPMERIVTEQAAGDLLMVRRAMARVGQVIIFFVTLMLATLLLSNLVEEKSNKVIEVLAAAVTLDAVFLGKLVAMLAISLVGLSLWFGILTLVWLFAVVTVDWFPQAAPAIGWPIYILLMLLYYGTNFMLLGTLFLGIGGQASSFREVQTLSMPVTLLQLMVLLLATNAIGMTSDDLLGWAAIVFPLSSPLAMMAVAAESAALWPHLLALLWQAIWVVLIIRISSRLFRATVLKTGTKAGFLQELRFWRGSRQVAASNKAE